MPRQSAHPDDLPIIEPSVMQNLMSLRSAQEPGDPDIVVTLIDLYLTETPDRIRRMREALRRQDTDDLKRAVHSLKGSSANLGVRVMTDLCRAFERHTDQTAPQDAESRLAEMEDRFQRIQARLLLERTKAESTRC